MKWRCSPRAHCADDYHARGITVCPRWESFEAFLADMGEPPFPRAQLDRRNNDLGYSPLNCRWVTNQTNSKNKRNNVRVTYRGETLTLYEWMARLGIDETRIKALRSRIHRKWTPEETFETPIDAPGRWCRRRRGVA